MRRETKRFNQGEGTFRIVNKIFDEPVDRNSANLHRNKYNFLRLLADTQDILRCGTEEYETLRVYYDGNCWVAESQTTIYGQE